jgi:hypothetical protein
MKVLHQLPVFHRRHSGMYGLYLPLGALILVFRSLEIPGLEKGGVLGHHKWLFIEGLVEG